MIYFLDSTRVPSMLSHADHAHVLLFVPYNVLSQPVFLGLWSIHNWASPWRLIRTPARVATPGTTRSCLPPRRVSLLVTLPLDLSASLPPEFWALLSYVFSVWYLAKKIYANPLLMEEFSNVIVNLPNVSLSSALEQSET